MFPRKKRRKKRRSKGRASEKRRPGGRGVDGPGEARLPPRPHGEEDGEEEAAEKERKGQKKNGQEQERNHAGTDHDLCYIF
jgi:hypothetical protein